MVRRVSARYGRRIGDDYMSIIYIPSLRINVKVKTEDLKIEEGKLTYQGDVCRIVNPDEE